MTEKTQHIKGAVPYLQREDTKRSSANKIYFLGERKMSLKIENNRNIRIFRLKTEVSF